MVGIHILYLKMPSAGGADTLLPLIHLAPRVAIKGANAEAMLIAGEDIAVTRRLLTSMSTGHRFIPPFPDNPRQVGMHASG